MALSQEEKKQILLATKEEWKNIETQYGRRIQDYYTVADKVYNLALECQKFKLSDSICGIRKRPMLVKEIETTKDKILRKRAEGWQDEKKKAYKDYNFDSVTDIAGIKIICGYISDQTLIDNWINETFKDVIKETITYTSGYKAWHYTVCLKRDVSPHLMNVRCEIQVKTALQAAWDDKTHDLVYKQEDVCEFEQLQFAYLSESLHVADKQSELIRFEIGEMRKEEQQKRVAAIREYWAGTEKVADEVGYKTKEEEFAEAEIDCLIKKIEQKAQGIGGIQGEGGSQEKNITLEKKNLLKLGVRISLETLNKRMKEWTLQYADRLLTSHQRDAYIWRVVSVGYWALGQRYDSLETVIKALELAEHDNKNGEKDKATNALVYFIADYGRKDLQTLGEGLLNEIKQTPPSLETAGFFFIKMAKDGSEVEKGKVLLRRAMRLAEEKGDKVTECFCTLSESIAGSKLRSLRLKEEIIP